MTGCGARSTFLSVHKNLFWQLVRDGNSWFGHVTRHDSFSKTILQGTLKGGRRRGRQRKCWMDNIKEWTFLPMPELLTRASCRKECVCVGGWGWGGYLLNRPSCPPDDSIGQGTELNLRQSDSSSTQRDGFVSKVVTCGCDLIGVRPSLDRKCHLTTLTCRWSSPQVLHNDYVTSTRQRSG